MSDDKEKVVPIRPDTPVHAKLLQGTPYTTPTDAITELLRRSGFDQKVLGAGGPIQLSIIGEFQETGCIIHKIALSHAIPVDQLKASMAPPPPPDPDQSKCSHHWSNKANPSVMECLKCGLAMDAKTWGKTYHTTPIIMPKD